MNSQERRKLNAELLEVQIEIVRLEQHIAHSRKRLAKLRETRVTMSNVLREEYTALGMK